MTIVSSRRLHLARTVCEEHNPNQFVPTFILDMHPHPISQKWTRGVHNPPPPVIRSHLPVATAQTPHAFLPLGVLTSTSPSAMSSRNHSDTLTSASLGQGRKRSICVQLISPGNLRHRERNASPTGEKHRTTCRFARTLGGGGKAR